MQLTTVTLLDFNEITSESLGRSKEADDLAMPCASRNVEESPLKGGCLLVREYLQGFFEIGGHPLSHSRKLERADFFAGAIYAGEQ
ncbi:hypothetical protein QFZ96_001818 [Paraburkholderia youngii]